MGGSSQDSLMPFMYTIDWKISDIDLWMCNTIKSEEDFSFWVDGVLTKKSLSMTTIVDYLQKNKLCSETIYFLECIMIKLCNELEIMYHIIFLLADSLLRF